MELHGLTTSGVQLLSLEVSPGDVIHRHLNTSEVSEEDQFNPYNPVLRWHDLIEHGIAATVAAYSDCFSGIKHIRFITQGSLLAEEITAAMRVALFHSVNEEIFAEQFSGEIIHKACSDFRVNNTLRRNWNMILSEHQVTPYYLFDEVLNVLKQNAKQIGFEIAQHYSRLGELIKHKYDLEAGYSGILIARHALRAFDDSMKMSEDEKEVWQGFIIDLTFNELLDYGIISTAIFGVSRIS